MTDPTQEEVLFIDENYHPVKGYNLLTRSKILSHASRASWRYKKGSKIVEVKRCRLLKAGTCEKNQARISHRPIEVVSAMFKCPVLEYGWAADHVDFPKRLNGLKQHMILFYGQDTMIHYIMPLAVRDRAVFSSMAYLACSNLDSLREDSRSNVAMITKGMAVRTLRERLSNLKGSLPSMNVLAIGCLAVSVNIYDYGMGTEFFRHLKALEMIFEMHGTQPPDQIGNVERVLNRLFALHRAAMPAVLNLEVPIADYPGKHLGHYNKLVHLGEEHPNRPDMVIESPFFCSAAADFAYIQKSPYCTSRTLDLLRDFRKYYLLLEAEAECPAGGDKDKSLVERAMLRHKIVQFGSIYDLTLTVPGTKLCDKNYIYECIRLACLALIHLSDTCISGRTAFHPSTAAVPIKVGPQELIPIPITSPRPTDLPDALGRVFRHSPSPIHGWGDAMEGLLYWTSTVATAISRGRPEYALFSSVNAKTIWDMGFNEDGRSWDEAIVPLWTFTRFQGMCLKGQIQPFMSLQENPS